MTAETGYTIPKLIETARMLKKVRRLRAECLLRWAMERAAGARLSAAEHNYDHYETIADQIKYDWRGQLYRGNVLDD